MWKTKGSRNTRKHLFFCTLLHKDDLQFSFLMYFHLKFLPWSIIPHGINERDKMDSDICSSTSYNVFHNTLSKFVIPAQWKNIVHKNMLKAQNFTKHKFRHRCFRKNLQKIPQTNTPNIILYLILYTLYSILIVPFLIRHNVFNG